MSPAHDTTSESSEREPVMTRILHAPRELVFKAWTDPKQVTQWWGPKGFTMLHCDVDLRPGGLCHYGMQSPDGSEMWGKFVYREIVEPERIVFTFAWEEEGERGRENLVTITFEEQGNKTRMTFRQAFFESISERDSHNSGWTSCFERLAQFLAGAR